MNPPGVTAYLVVKQDDNGITFVVTAADGCWIADVAAACVRVEERQIGAWVQPREEDVPDPDVHFGARLRAVGRGDDPAF